MTFTKYQGNNELRGRSLQKGRTDEPAIDSNEFYGQKGDDIIPPPCNPVADSGPAPFTTPFLVDELVENDSGPANSATVGVLFTPTVDTDLTSVVLRCLKASFGVQDSSVELREGATVTSPVLFTTPIVSVGSAKENRAFDMTGSPRLIGGQNYTITLTQGSDTLFIMSEESSNTEPTIGRVSGSSTSVADMNASFIGFVE